MFVRMCVRMCGILTFLKSGRYLAYSLVVVVCSYVCLYECLFECSYVCSYVCMFVRMCGILTFLKSGRYLAYSLVGARWRLSSSTTWSKLNPEIYTHKRRERERERERERNPGTCVWHSALDTH